MYHLPKYQHCLIWHQSDCDRVYSAFWGVCNQESSKSTTGLHHYRFAKMNCQCVYSWNRNTSAFGRSHGNIYLYFFFRRNTDRQKQKDLGFLLLWLHDSLLSCLTHWHWDLELSQPFPSIPVGAITFLLQSEQQSLLIFPFSVRLHPFKKFLTNTSMTFLSSPVQLNQSPSP